MPLYIEKINGDVNRPTNQPTDRQGEYRAICLFRKLENRKKAEICNFLYQVDCHETSKDNPALSQQAASGVRAFYALFVIVKIRQMFAITKEL